MHKNSQIKKNHHYIWSFYLKNWSNNRRDIFYKSLKGNIALDSVKGLAKETGFYNISWLSQKDIDFILRLSSRSPTYLQDIHKNQLNRFIKLLNKNSDINTIDPVVQHNSLEDTHAFFERNTVKVIRDLVNGKIEVLEKEVNMLAFCCYLGQKVTRTKAFKEKGIDAVRTTPDYGYKNKKEYTELFEKNWWFLSYMFGINMGSLSVTILVRSS